MEPAKQSVEQLTDEQKGAITPQEFARKMRQVGEQNADVEICHKAADELLLEVLRQQGYGEGCDVFDSMNKWYA